MVTGILSKLWEGLKELQGYWNESSMAARRFNFHRVPNIGPLVNDFIEDKRQAVDDYRRLSEQGGNHPLLRLAVVSSTKEGFCFGNEFFKKYVYVEPGPVSKDMAMHWKYFMDLASAVRG